MRNLTGLTRQGRIKLFAALDLGLRHNGDTFRAEQDTRRGPDRFASEVTILDDGRVHHFRFVVNDASASYGVLQIEYAEEST